jgi:hypothetical protein
MVNGFGEVVTWLAVLTLVSRAINLPQLLTIAAF